MTAPGAKVEAARQAAAPERDRFMTDAETTGAGLPKRRAGRILPLLARRPPNRDGKMVYDTEPWKWAAFRLPASLSLV